MTLFCPAEPMPNQRFNVSLDGQSMTIALRWRSTGLFVDVAFQNGATIVAGVIAQDRNRLVRSACVGFIGDLAWVDTLGSFDPDWLGIGSRFFLLYLTPDELAGSVIR